MMAAVTQEISQDPGRGESLGQNGGQGSSRHSHVQPVNKQRIEQDVGPRPDKHGDHGQARLPIGAQEIVQPNVEDLENSAKKDHTHV